jgi:hypothetical protein
VILVRKPRPPSSDWPADQCAVEDVEHDSEIPERDRAFLWAAGLLGVAEFSSEVSNWGDVVSYPGTSD